ncbi:DUF6247 family protein [Pseudonocardia oroxyli]|uniref:Uncharacterized protein n=1 Tax=Pseudonocardia oroxyli TaxID=366584 RepID=A0A1G7ZGZ9_PSEOR|nr:DUF6247 family protein [Pseudonocardia oroxyli]SDH07954.1 hypothetical protein SAMN05216377_118135 [Pseudonocardia oroxyli]
MTAQPVHRADAVPPAPASAPAEIRRHLLPEEAGQFDSEWRAAMARSAEALDLTEVYRILDRWRDIAAMTQADPEAHRHMLHRAQRILAGHDHGTITAAQLRAKIARRLDTTTEDDTHG